MSVATWLVSIARRKEYIMNGSENNRSLEVRTLLVLEHLRVLLTRLKSCSTHDFGTRFQEECDAPLQDVKVLAKSWYIKLSLLVALSAISGCSAVSSQTYDASGLTPYHAAMFRDVATQWCFSPLACCWFEGTSRAELTVRYASMHECLDMFGERCSGLASSDDIGLVLEASNMSSSIRMREVMAHELGHVCGCGHTSSGIMASNPEGTDYDAAARRCLR